MTRSLKERYDNKRLFELRRRVASTDARVVSEQRAASLLVEAIDDDDLEKVAAIVQKLSTVKVPQLPKLKAAIEKAEAEINRYTAGGPLAQAWTKMKDLVGIDNPVVKVTAFADALEKGFSQIPQILKNNGVDLKGVDLNKSLVQILGRMPEPSAQTKKKPSEYKSEKETGNSPFSGKDVSDVSDYSVPGPHSEGVTNEDSADGSVLTRDKKAATQNAANVEKRLKSIAGQLRKALAPSGVFGAFKNVPYIDGAALADELIRAPLSVFSQVAKRINSGTKAADVAPDMKGQASGGDVETRGTSKEEPAKPTSQTLTSAPAKQTTVANGATASGEKPPEPRGGGAEQNYTKAREKLRSVIHDLEGQKNVYDLLAKKLVDAGLDPDRL